MKTQMQTMMWSLMLAGGLAVALPTVRAQDESAESKPKMERREGGPAQRLEALRERLGLTDAQVAQLKEIFAAEREEIAAKRKELGKDADRRAVREAMQPIREKYRAKIEAVLTPEQREKWAKQRPGRGEGAGPGGPGGGEGKKRRGPDGGEGGGTPPAAPDADV